MSRAERALLGLVALATVLAGVTRFVGGISHIVAFVFATIALAGLAWVVSFSTEQLGEHLGPAATGVLHSTLGNLPEFFVVIFALNAGQRTVAQTAILGSILVNALLVLGLVIVAGARRSADGIMRFSPRLPNDTATLLFVATFIIVLIGLANSSHDPASHHARTISIVGAVAILIVYVSWLRQYLTSGDSEPREVSNGRPAEGSRGRARERSQGRPAEESEARPAERSKGRARERSQGRPAEGSEARPAEGSQRRAAQAGRGRRTEAIDGKWAGESHARPTGPRLSLALTVALLAAAATGAAFVSDWFIHALEPTIKTLDISPAFAGLVIVAIAGNAVENITGIALAAKGRSELAISVVKNSVSQIAAFLFPVLVLASLLTSTVLTFSLAPVYIGALFGTAVIVWQITGDGEATVFEGAALVAAFVIMATVAAFE